jgi:hypothetical protein
MKNNFPKQKIANSKKTKQWAKDCIDKAIMLTSLENPTIRQSRKNKVINYNLLNDILDEKDVRRIVNPYNIKGASFPAKMQNYPICLPKIDLLVGEESKRRFSYTVVAQSRNVIESKDKERADNLREAINQIVAEGKEVQEGALNNYLRKKLDYVNYEMKDYRELASSLILEHYWKELELPKMFNDGFMDLLAVAEENYCIDIEVDDVVATRWNPLNVETFRSGGSPWLQDAEIIKYSEYYPIGMVVDKYNDFLKPSDIDKLEMNNFGTKDEGILNVRPDMEFNRLPYNAINRTGKDTNGAVFDFGNGELFDPSLNNGAYFGSSFDTDGNVLVTKVLWKSFRKIGFLTYFDENGRLQKEMVSEEFKANPDLGQDVRWRWISEWWEGTKIGNGSDSIYVKVRRRPVQFRKSGNPSVCQSGVVGLAYNINSNKAMSLLDRMKPLQYLYNVLMYRTELAFAKSHGKIMRLPLHEIPDKWSMDKWLAFAFGQNIAVFDAFKEIKKGPATGKLAGNMQQSNQVIDMEMGSYIQQHVSMMVYIKEEIGEISGVSKARQGQIEERAAVGNTQREVSQSAHITERWFMAHDLVKKKFLEVLLDTALVALKKNPHKAEIILGSFIAQQVELVIDELSQIEMGIHVSNASEDMELLNALKQQSAQAVQAQLINFSELANIYASKSIAEITRKLESNEVAKSEREQAAAEQENATLQKMAEEELAWEKEKHYSELELKMYEIDTNAVLKEAQLMETQEPENRIMDIAKLRQTQFQIEQDYTKHKELLELKKEELREKIRTNKSKEAIQRSKPKAVAR